MATKKRKQVSWRGPAGRDRSTIDGRSWVTRDADKIMQRVYRDDEFQPTHGAELISALQGHRLSQGNADVYGPGLVWFKDEPATTFNSSAKLDKSMIDDRRGEYLRNPKLFRSMLAHNRNPTDITDRRLGRPAPKIDKRIGAAGRHNSEDASRFKEHPLSAALKKVAKRGAMAGDGRLERPAPAPEREGPPMRSAAGSRHSRRVIATRPGEKLPSTKPKPKPKPRFNQGQQRA